MIVHGHPKTIKNDYFKGQNDGNTVILLGVAPCSYASPAVSQQKIRTPSPGTPCGKRKIWDVFECPAMSCISVNWVVYIMYPVV
jgi:hypothetical protein